MRLLLAGLLLGMLLTLVLDALSAAGEANFLILLSKLLFLGALPLGLLLYLLVQLANQRLDERLDHEWTKEKEQAAASKRGSIWMLIILCGVFLAVTWWSWAAS